VNAQFNLGALHTTGRGVEKSDEEAVKWFGAAAAQGDVQAQEQLERIEANMKSGKGKNKKK
jgi:TPR repeat protein